MKNLFSLILLIGCFSFFCSSTVKAQDKVRNSTNCDFRITVLYGPNNNDSCLSLASITAIVPANSQISLGFPAGSVIIKATGGYNQILPSSSCYFTVGQHCTGFPASADIVCSGGCGNYEVTYIPSFGLKLGS